MEAYYRDAFLPHLASAKQVLQNYTQPTSVHADKVTVGFSYSHPPNFVKDVLRSTAQATKDILENPAPVVRTVEYGDSSINYEVMYWMQGVDRRYDIRERFMTRIWYAAQRNQLNIPFPIRTLYHADGGEADSAQEALDRDMAAVPLFGQDLGGDGGLDSLAQEATLQHFGVGERVL
ncbi:MAG: hypothetical protein ACR2GR_00065 [Rhodothermales bacterium]